MLNYIIFKDLHFLLNTKIYSMYSGMTDNSIIISAMADFIKFSNSQIGMPVLIEDINGVYITDGIKLLESLKLSNYDKKIACIFSSKTGVKPPETLIKFSLSEAEKFGTDARVISFHLKINSDEAKVLSDFWKVSPDKLNEHTIGWDEIKAHKLNDWLTWWKQVEYVSRNIKSVAAVNGRFFS